MSTALTQQIELPLRSPKVSKAPRGVQPPLKWAGGKRWQLPILQPLWQPHKKRRLVEPFCGGLAISLGLMPERALLNDINPHLINFYRSLKKGLSISLELKNDRLTFYRCRQRFNQLLCLGRENTPEAAILFYYLNRTGYNGLCRFNSKGEFNVPFGRYDKITYRITFEEYKQAFAYWKFTVDDFENIEIRPSDFIYADPPYDVEFRQYSQRGFDWNEQERAARWLSKHTGPVILSNQATSRIIDLYDSLGFSLRFLRAPRRISCTGDRSPASEVLATRNL